jgi:hypothetical protein
VNSKNATDSTTADGTVSTSGQSSSANVSFDEAKLCALSAPAYKVYLVTSDGSEMGGDQLLNFNDNACLSGAPDPDKVDLSNPSSVTLRGNRLDTIKKVCLGTDARNEGDTFDVTSTATKITLDFDKTKPKAGSPNIYLGDCGNSRIRTGMTLTISDTATPNKPVLDSKTPFTPTSGKVGTLVTIKGSNLTGASEVKFGSVAQTSVTVVSNIEITAAVPKGATGSKPIEVTTPSGTVKSKTYFTVTSK